jgi:uncharacterized protein YfaS (alpha-2-macroglobulin family)
MFLPKGEVLSFTQAAVMFNQPMAALGDFEDVDQSLLTLDPPLPGKVLWLNQFTLAFVPDAPAQGCLTVKMRLSPEVRSLSGAVLGGEPLEETFTLPALKVENTWEERPATVEEALKPVFTVTFNQPVDPSLLQGKTFFAHGPEGAAAKVPAVWAVPQGAADALGRVRRLQAAAREPLPRDTEYRLIIEKGARILVSVPPLEEDFTAASGRTYGPLAATLEIPQEGYMEEPDSDAVGISFSNPVRLSKVLAFVEVDPPVPSLTELKRIWAEAAQASSGAGRAEAAPDGPAGPEAGGSASADGSGQAGENEEPQSWLYLWSPFLANARYTFTLKKGLPDIYGQTLQEDRVFQVRTGAFKPFAAILPPDGVLESALAPQVPVRIRNMPEVKAFGRILTDSEAAGLFSQGELRYFDFGTGPFGYYPEAAKKWADAALSGGRGGYSLTLKPSGDTSRQPATEILDLQALFQGSEKRGVLLAGAGGGEQLSFFQVTDLALTVKAGLSGSLAWVTRLSTGRPEPGAAVSVLDCQGRALWQGETGEDGLARIPGAKELLEGNPCPGSDGGESLPLYFVASDAVDRVFWSVEWGSGFSPWEAGLDYQAYRSPLDADRFRTFLVASQPIYKPGETARLKVIARAEGDTDRPLRPGPVRALIQAPGDDWVHDVTLEQGPYGTFSFDYALPKDARHGYYQVLLDLAPEKGRNPSDLRAYGRDPDAVPAGGFKVGFYRPPAFDLSFEGIPREAYPGDRLKLAAKGTYHYGAPLASGEAEFSLGYEAKWDFAPPGFPARWSFTAPTALEKDGEGGWVADVIPPGTAASAKAPVSRDGAALFEAEIPQGFPPAPMTWTASATVQDADSRPVYKAETFMSHPASLYVGLSNQDFFARAGEGARFSAVVAALDGTVKAGVKVRLSLVRRSWTTSRRMTPGGAYGMVSSFTDEKVAETELTSSEAPAEAELTPQRSGYHYILAEVTDDQGRANMAAVDLYVFGGGPAEWPSSNGDRLEIQPDRPEYKPGDTARLIVKSPFKEGHGLLTVERAGIREARVFDLEGGAPVLEIPLGEDDAPAVFASVTLVRGRVSRPSGKDGADLGRPSFRTGYAVLNVRSDRYSLKVEVAPSAPEFRPGGQASVKVKVTDAQGNPFSDAEVALAVVDAGLIQVGGDAPFHPESELWKILPLRVQTAGSISAVNGRVDWANKGGSPSPSGGGGYAAGEDQSVRKDFRTVAFFDPAVKLDSGGEAEAAFTLPDSLTSFKIYAVATGEGRRTGTGEGALTVTQDLILRASLPNHLTVGDEFAASAIVSVLDRPAAGPAGAAAGAPGAAADGAQAAAAPPAPREARVEISPLAGLELLEGPVKTVSVVPGESVEVSFRARATAPGEVSAGFDAASGESRDLSMFSIPAGYAGRELTEASFKEAGEGYPMPALKIPDGADPGRGGLLLTFSPGITGTLSAPFEALERYPYVCLEQSTSRAAGAVYELRLKQVRPVSPEREAELRKRVESQIRLIASSQLGGGFTLWPGGDWERRSPVLTAWVLDFVREAREAGFKVPEGIVSYALEYLAWCLTDEGKAEGWSLTGARRLYVLGAMARAGRPLEAEIEQFYQKRAGLRLAERIYLLRAAAAVPLSRTRTGQLLELIPSVASEVELSGITARIKDAGTQTEQALWLAGERDLSAAALLALTEAAPHHELIPQLLMGVVSGDAGGAYGSTNRTVTVLRGVWNWLEAREKAEALLARDAEREAARLAREADPDPLANVASGSPGKPAPADPSPLDLAVKVLMGAEPILEGKLDSFSSPSLETEIAMSLLAGGQAPSLEITGRGKLWAFQRLSWAPKVPDLSPKNEHGITVTRVFQRMLPEPGPAGESLFRRGELVKVTVTLMTTVERYNLVVEDPVPAGLEPVDFSLKDQNPRLAELLAEDPSASDPWIAFWKWYDYREIRPECVRLYADRVSPGVYTFNYLARPVTPGTYMLPGTYAEEMYNPENYGRGSGLTVTVIK